jgi:hypothetical protein
MARCLLKVMTEAIALRGKDQNGGLDNAASAAMWRLRPRRFWIPGSVSLIALAFPELANTSAGKESATCEQR